MHRIVKTGYIDMAHRIRGHKGKCRFLHGHTWKIELSVSCEDGQLDKLGMVIDFGELKTDFFCHVDAFFDHSCILGAGDKQALSATPSVSCVPSAVEHLSYALTGVPDGLGVRFLDFDVSAERLAKYFYDLACAQVGSSRVKVDYVRVYEQLHPTESYAEYRPSEERDDES